MDIQETRKLQKLIYDIYYNGEDPAKFGEMSGIENYMEELYPSDFTKLVGDWIESRFPPKTFLNQEVLNKRTNELKDLYNKVIYYANIPSGKTLKSIIGELQKITNDDTLEE